MQKPNIIDMVDGIWILPKWAGKIRTSFNSADGKSVNIVCEYALFVVVHGIMILTVHCEGANN